MSRLRAVAGDTTLYRFTCLAADDTPLDLSDGTATFTARRYVSTEPVITKTETDGLTISDPASDGLIDLQLEPEDTEGLSGYYVWDLEVRLGDSVYTLDSGRLSVVPGITGSGP